MLEEKTKALDKVLGLTSYGLERRKQQPEYPSKLKEITKEMTNLFLLTNPTMEKMQSYEMYVPGEWMLVETDDRHKNVGIEEIPMEINGMISTYQEKQNANEGPNLFLS